MERVIVGISGASGIIYGVRLLETLKAIGSGFSTIYSGDGGKIPRPCTISRRMG